MTEGHQSPHTEKALRLNITDWAASGSQNMWREGSGDISPLSRVEGDNTPDMSLPGADGTPPSSAHSREHGSNATTPVPPARPRFDVAVSDVDWRHELRKIIRDEVSEPIQKLASEVHGQYTAIAPSVAGSVTSSSSSVPDHPNHSLVTQGEPSTASTATQRPVVRFSERHFSERRTFSKRPAGVSRTSSSSHPPAEWGDLFDADAHATSRLGQVLRGLAKHIIEEYTPKNSLVITPDKLQAFYSKYRLDPEPHSFPDMLASSAKDFHERLAEFYEDMECQHHLVQKSGHSKAKIPALTPLGFAQYLTICILAYPDQEFQRLDRIVTDIALFADATAPDGQPEKLPKSIIRACLPAKPDLRKKKLLDETVEDLLYELKVHVPGPRHSFSTLSSSDRRGSVGTSSRDSSDRLRHAPPRPHRTSEESVVADEYDPRSPGRKRFTSTTLQSIGDESLVEVYERNPHNDWTRQHVGEQQEKGEAGAGAMTVIGPPREGGGARLRDADEHGPVPVPSSTSSPNTPHSLSHSGRPPQRPVLSHHQPQARSQSYTHGSTAQEQQPGTALANASFAPSGTIPPPPIGPRAYSFSFASPSSPPLTRVGGPHSPSKLRGFSISVPDVVAGVAAAGAPTAGAVALASSPAQSSTTANDTTVATGVYTPASTSSSDNSAAVSPTTTVLDHNYGGGSIPGTTDRPPLVHNMLDGRRDSTDYGRYHQSQGQNHYRLSTSSLSGSNGGGYYGQDDHGNGNHVNADDMRDALDKHPHTQLSTSSSSSLATIQPRSGGGGPSSDRRSERSPPPPSPSSSRHHQKSSHSRRHGSTSSSGGHGHGHGHSSHSHGGGGGGSSSSKRRSMPPPSLSLSVPRSHAPPPQPGGADGDDDDEGEEVIVVAAGGDPGPTWKEYFRDRTSTGSSSASGSATASHRGHGHGPKTNGYHGGY